MEITERVCGTFLFSWIIIYFNLNLNLCMHFQFTWFLSYVIKFSRVKDWIIWSVSHLTKFLIYVSRSISRSYNLLSSLWLKLYWQVFHSAGMQSQLVCNGCRSILLYPRGATNVCCALCNTITSVPPPGMFLLSQWKNCSIELVRCILEFSCLYIHQSF